MKFKVLDGCKCYEVELETLKDLKNFLEENKGVKSSTVEGFTGVKSTPIIKFK